MNEDELARLVVRLIGDTESYQKMFTEAAEKAAEMEKATKRLGAAEKATADAIRIGAEVTKQAASSSDRYGQEVAQLNSLLESGAITQETHNAAMDQAKRAASSSVSVLQNLDTAYESYASTVTELDQLLKVGAITQTTYARAIERAQETARSSVPALGALKSATGEYANQVRDLRTFLRTGVISQQQYNQAVAQAKQTAVPALQQLETAQSKFTQRTREYRSALSAGIITQSEFNRLMSASKKEATAGVFSLNNLETVTEKYSNEIRELNAHLSAGTITQRQYNQAADGLRSVIASSHPALQGMATATDKYSREVVEINALLRSGIITQDQHTKALENARRTVMASVPALQNIERSSEKYTRQVKELDALLRKDIITQEQHGRAVRKAAIEYRQAGNAATTYGRQIRSIGQAGLFRVTAPIVGIGIAAVTAGSDIESAFAGVRKTVDASEEQLQGLKSQFEDFIVSGGAPFDITELLGAAETAGQLGVDFDNIFDFSKTVKNLELATDLGDAAGESLARIANITGLPQTEFSNLGSTIVALGNNSAATESQIVDMTLRLAGAGKQIGLTVPQTTAFAASLASVGINAEAGGTAFSQLFINLSKQVAIGGKDLAAFARTANMSVDEFSTAFRTDAAGAVQSLLRGLNEMEGSDAIQALDEMGIEGVLLTDAMLRSSGAVDLMENSMNLAATAFAENTALAAEAEQRYDTFAGIVKNAWAQLRLLGEEIFQKIQPALRAAIEGVTDAVAWFKGLDDTVQAIVITFAAVAAVIPPILIGLGSLLSIGGNVAILYTTLTKGTLLFAGANVTAAGATGGLTIATVALKAALTAVPYMAVAASITAVIGLVADMTLSYIKLNQELEKSGKLNDTLIGDMKRRAEATIQEAKAQATQGNNGAAQTTITLGLQDAEQRLEGFRNQVKAAAADVKANAWNIIDRGALKEARQELDEALARVKAGQAEVERFKNLLGTDLTQVPSPAGSAPAEAATAPAAPVPASSPEALASVKEFNAGLERQIETFGMSQREAALYSLRLDLMGTELDEATKKELEFAEARPRWLEASEKAAARSNAIDATTESLQRQIDVIGMSPAEVKLFELKSIGAGEEQLQKLAAMFAEYEQKTDAANAAAKQKADAQKLIDKFMPPADKVAKRVAELQELLDKGLIDQGTFESAVTEAEKELDKLKADTDRDYTVKLGVKGVDAVEIGSAEALARVREYFANPPEMPELVANAPQQPDAPVPPAGTQPTPAEKATVAGNNQTATSDIANDRELRLRGVVAMERLVALQEGRPLIELEPSSLR